MGPSFCLILTKIDFIQIKTKISHHYLNILPICFKCTYTTITVPPQTVQNCSSRLSPVRSKATWDGQLVSWTVLDGLGRNGYETMTKRRRKRFKSESSQNRNWTFTMSPPSLIKFHMMMCDRLKHHSITITLKEIEYFRLHF